MPLQLQQRADEAIDDPLTEVAREGARRMLAQVLIAEADSFIAMWKDLRLPDGRDRIVRQGHGPHRAIQTGIGPVEVRRAKVRDRGEVGAEEKIRFTSSILPKWARRTKSLDALLPVLYLRAALSWITPTRSALLPRPWKRSTSLQFREWLADIRHFDLLSHCLDVRRRHVPPIPQRNAGADSTTTIRIRFSLLVCLPTPLDPLWQCKFIAAARRT